jgi:F0F1-type ATP synthase membrane subunit b/b'
MAEQDDLIVELKRIIMAKDKIIAELEDEIDEHLQTADELSRDVAALKGDHKQIFEDACREINRLLADSGKLPPGFRRN